MEKIKNILSRWYVVAASMIVLFVVAHWKSLHVFFESPIIQGWDGAAHFAASIEYANHIFPSVWGWIPNWLGGMPFPQYYTPLFLMLLGGLYKVFFFVSPLLVFKLFVVVSQISFIGASMYVLSSYVKHGLARWVGGLSMVVLLSATSYVLGNQGVTILSTINTGMIAQLLSAICFVWFAYTLERSVHSRSAFVGASVSFAGIVLGNAHFIIPSIVFFVLTALFILAHSDQKKVVSIRLFFVGLAALCLTVFWTFPLLRVYGYLTTYPSFEIPGVFDVMRFGIIPIVLAVGLGVGIWKKNRQLLFWSVFLLLLLSGFGLAEDFSGNGVVAHVQRWIALFVMFIPLMIALLFDMGMPFLKQWWMKLGAVVGVCAVLFFSIPIISLGDTEGMYKDYVTDRVADIVSYVKAHPVQGMLNVEAIFVDNQPTVFALNSILGQYTPVSVFNLRESSISSQFLTPVRNSFSLNHEGWGFKSYLMFNQRFTRQPVEQSLDRAARLGIQSFLVTTPYAKERLAADPRIKQDADFGAWTLFSFIKETPRAYIPEYEPFAFYGAVSFKDRAISDYDWGKVQEALLYHNLPYVTFYPPDQYLDTSPALDHSPAVYIAEYRYRDLIAAYNRIVTYAKDHQVILVSSDNDLFRALAQRAAEDASLRFTIVVRQPTVLSSGDARKLEVLQFEDPLLPQLGAVFSQMNLPKVESGVSVVGTSFSPTQTTVELSGTPENTPVLITQSYFPAWRTTAPLFMASPSYMLVYATTPSIELVFNTPSYVPISSAVSVITSIILICFWCNVPKKIWSKLQQ